MKSVGSDGSGWMTKPTPAVIVLLTGLSLVIFAIDIGVRSGFALGLPHVGVVLLSLRVRSRWLTLSLASFTTVLIVTALLISPAAVHQAAAITNRVLTVLVLWAIAGLSVVSFRVAQLTNERDTADVLTRTAQSIVDLDLSMKDLASRLRTGLEELVPVELLVVSIYQSESDSFVHFTSAADDFETGSMDTDSLRRLKDHLARKVLESDVTADLNGFEDSSLPISSEKLNGVISGTIAVPFEYLGSRFGALQIYSSIDGFDGEAIRAIVELLALQVSGALYASRQHQGTARLIEQLKRSNSDLEQFAYVTSHDLQEPVRKILAFGDRLEAPVMTLGNRDQDYFARIANSARRMQTLIEDLLDFSRLTTRAKPFRQLNLNDVVDKAVANLEVSVEHSEASIHVEQNLPSLAGDETQLIQLFQNLIGNAIKFKHPERTPEITIRSVVPPSVTVDDSDSLGDHRQLGLVGISISDNGIGFDNKYAFKIFNIFQRLQGRSAFEGNGIGLAFCKNIVQRHNGSIEADSVPNLGTTFTVTLPKWQSGSTSASQAKEQERNVA